MNQTEAPRHNGPQTGSAAPCNAPDTGWRGRPIVLVGIMGSGKTTVGRRLAHQLALPFHDADAEIESAAAMPVTEIFARFGEKHFRDGERRVIARLMELGPAVIATGGGAFVDAETRARILTAGTAIWLDAAIETLVQRVGKRGGRPLLVGRDPREVLTELMAVRRPSYEQAHIHIRSANGPHDQTVEAILAELARRETATRP